jgi:glutaredoxin-like protein NrdH
LHIAIYTKPQCQPCRATKKKFDQLGIPYEEVSAGDAVDHLRSLGYTSAPVVEADYGEGVTTSWSGYRPDLIGQLCLTLSPPVDLVG